MREILEENPTLDILDCTKLKDYERCPRLFFFKYLRGWKSSISDHNLWFGICFHKAVEYIYEQWKHGERKYSNRVLVEAERIFLEDYRKQYGVETDAGTAKNPAGVDQILEQYAKKFGPYDDFEVLFAEISGTVPIGVTEKGDVKKIYFRLDTLIKDEEGYKVLEHKTSGWSTRLWSATWPLDIQPGMACHVLKCLYGEEAKGVIMNGFFFRPQLKTKETTHELLRVPVRKSPLMLQGWLNTISTIYDDYYRDLEHLRSEDISQDIMKSFVRRPGNCTKYNRLCEYHDWCFAKENPVQYTMPAEFKEEFWDPRAQDKEWTGKVEI